MSSVLVLSRDLPAPLPERPPEQGRVRDLQLRELDHSYFGITPATIKQVSLIILGISLLTGAGITLALWLEAVISVWLFGPLFAGSLLASLIAFTIFGILPHYDSDEHLTQYREEIDQRFAILTHRLVDPQLFGVAQEAAGRFLRDVINEHSWTNIFYYGIPLPSQFQAMFAMQVDHMPLHEALDFYQEAVSAYEKVCIEYPNDHFVFEIPHPSLWAGGIEGKWVRETQTMPLSHIFERYSLEQLYQLNVIFREEYDCLTDLYEGKEADPIYPFEGYKAIKAEYDEKTAGVRRAFETLKAPIVNRFESRMGAITKEYDKHPAHMSLRALERKYVEDYNQLCLDYQKVCEPYQQTLDYYKGAKEGAFHPEVWDGAIQDEERKIELKFNQFQERKEGLERRYSEKRRQIELGLMNKFTWFKEKEKTIFQDFHQEFDPIEADFHSQIAPAKEEFDEKLRGLTRLYNQKIRLPRLNLNEPEMNDETPH